MKHENKVTLSIYVKNITALVYEPETKKVEERTVTFYNERVPSENVLIKELKEEYKVNVIDILSITDNKELSGLYEMPHVDFVKFGKRTGDVREKKVKEW